MNLDKKYSSTLQDFGDVVRIEVRLLNTKLVLAEAKALQKSKNRFDIVSVNGSNTKANQYAVDKLTKYLKGE